MELAALLSAARATVEKFCQGTGLIFKNEPSDLLSLANVLDKAVRKEPGAAELATIARAVQARLAGLVFDPDVKGKKALRDLIQHRQQPPIRIIVGPEGRSAGALIDTTHPQLIHFPNSRVTVAANETWGQTRRLLAESLPMIVTILETRRHHAATAR
jgi:hypothetical protein